MLSSFCSHGGGASRSNPGSLAVLAGGWHEKKALLLLIPARSTFHPSAEHMWKWLRGVALGDPQRSLPTPNIL